MQTASKYRPDIDGLRAVAVLSVVVFHAFPSMLPGGFVGVDVFFVISGYIITRLLAAEWQSRGDIDIAAFYARRVRRIFPALILVVVATVAASVVLLRDIAEAREVARSAAAALVFVGNWYFQVNTGGYFDPSTDRLPLLHLWSLGVEEQYYLIWPLTMAFILRRRPALLFRVLAVAAVASFALAAVLSITNANAAFYLMPARFWELAAGGLIALSTRSSSSGAPRLATAGGALILLTILIPPYRFQAASVLAAVIGAGMLLRAIHSEAHLGLASCALRSRIAGFFGRISYSMYLWHWPMLALASALSPGGTSIWIRIAICIASILLGWASFRFVESPLRRPSPATPNRRLVFAGILTTTALAYFSTVVAREIPPPSMPPNPLIAATETDYPRNLVSCHYSFKDGFQDFPRPGCDHNPATGPARVVIWGDSKAYAWQPLAWALADQMAVSSTSFTRDSCAPALGYDNSTMPLEASKCREFNALAASHLDASDTLILAAAWPQPGERDFEKRFSETVARVAAKVERVIILGPTPVLRGSVPRCIAAKSIDACAISRPEFEAQAAQVSRALAAMGARFQNVEYVSLESFFCTGDICPATRDGYGLYWDSSHVSSSAARAFAKQYLSR